MKFEVIGADRETGEDAKIIVDARDEVDAEAIAGRRNIMVSHVALVPLARLTQVTRQVPPPPLEPGHVAGVPSINVHLPRRSSSLGIVSLVLGIVAFLFCWIPLVGILSIPLSALGLLLGAIGLLVAVHRRGSGIGYPIGGAAVCGLALAIGIAQATVIAAPLFVASELAERAKAISDPAAWVSANQPLKIGDVQVRVVSATVGKIRMKGSLADGYESADSYLKLVIEVSNSSQDRKLDFASWMGSDFSISRDYASVRDNHNNLYKRIDFGFTTRAEGQIDRESLYPGKSVRDVLVFEPPIRNVEYLRLELPAKNFGEDGMIRFQIPAEMIKQ
jgi:hypothetical protein